MLSLTWLKHAGLQPFIMMMRGWHEVARLNTWGSRWPRGGEQLDVTIPPPHSICTSCCAVRLKEAAWRAGLLETQCDLFSQEYWEEISVVLGRADWTPGLLRSQGSQRRDGLEKKIIWREWMEIKSCSWLCVMGIKQLGGFSWVNTQGRREPCFNLPENTPIP